MTSTQPPEIRNSHTDNHVDTTTAISAPEADASRLRKNPDTQFLSPAMSVDSSIDGDKDSVNTAIHDGSSAQTRILAPAPMPESSQSRRLSVDDHNSSDNDDDDSSFSDSDSDSFSSSDDDDEEDTNLIANEDAPNPNEENNDADEKPVTWSSLPKKSQLAILTIARLSEPLTQTSLQAYMFYQLKSFDPSLPDSTISGQAGILQGSFTAAQFLTAVWWGRLADAEWMGRKRVLLIGSLGTCISCLGFGFSRSFVAAAVFRTLGGVLNSNVGVMRTMIAEIIEEKKYVHTLYLF